MKILIAEDDAMTRLALQSSLEKWGHAVTAVDDGGRACAILEGDAPPRLAILDWLMPGMEGIDICRRLVGKGKHPLLYIILLTIKREKKDIIAALEAGADDFLSKPVHIGELHSRIRVGIRVIQANEKLHHEIQERKQAEVEKEKLIRQLREALKQVKTLSGLLPICASCKKIRDDKGYWNQIEEYIANRSDAEFTHGVCPECMEKIYGDQEWYREKKT